MNYKPALRSINRLLTILKKASILDAITCLISTNPLKSQGVLPLSLQNSKIRELRNTHLYRDIVENGCGSDKSQRIGGGLRRCFRERRPSRIPDRQSANTKFGFGL